MSAALIAWIIVGAIAVLSALIMLIREIPSIRRELHLLRM